MDGKPVCYSVLMRVNDKGEEDKHASYAVVPWIHDELISRCVELLNLHGFEPKL